MAAVKRKPAAGPKAASARRPGAAKRGTGRAVPARKTGPAKPKRAPAVSAAAAADRLEKYRRRRDFGRTGEPPGEVVSEPGPKPIFVVQMHDATRLHYDFRIESEGAMPSWAVPKGFSLDPAVVRLAVKTEDHPLEYADFEGNIPEGEYGAGPVLVWDRGFYTNIREAKPDDGASIARSIDEGKVEIWLHGEKLKGGFVLVRTRVPKKGGEQWILKKLRDSQADPDCDIVAARPESVKSGLTIDRIRARGAPGVSAFPIPPKPPGVR